MNTSLPGISVVIPTRNRSQLIAPLLTSLQSAADNFDGPSEVILIDDSSPPEAAKIRALCEQNGARFLPGTPSVREKRNLGIQQARYPIVLFVDSDVQVAPDLFTQHARIYSDREPAIAGVVGVTNFVGSDTWMWQVIGRTQFLNAFSFARRMDYAPWATCSNTSYRKDVLNESGGFETKFPFRLGGDDADLGIRLNKAGYKIKSNPEAIVNHTRETWNSFVAMWRRAFRWGRMDVHLYYRRHTDRVIVGLPKFSHVLLALILVALIQAIWRLSFWPLVLPFLWAAFVLVIVAAQTVIITKESWRYLPHELAADILGLAFEMGAILEGIRRGELAVLYKTVRRGPVLPTFEQQEWGVQAWSMWIGIVLVLLIEGIAIR